MDEATRKRLADFVKPLHQDLDGVSRSADVARVSTIARRLHSPLSVVEDRRFDLLLQFQNLESWLGRLGNISRAALMIGPPVAEQDLVWVLKALRRLDEPGSAEEKALATAIRIDRGGIRGLVEAFGSARRLGATIMEIARDESEGDVDLPSWIEGDAARWLRQRSEARRVLCRALMRETEGADLDQSDQGR